MMPGAVTNHSAHVEQVKLIAAVQGWRNVADKTLQRATPAENTKQQVAGIDLREPACRQLEHVVSGAVSESANDDHIACPGGIRARHKRDCFVQSERRRCRPDLVDVDDVDFRVHCPPPNLSRSAFSLMKPSASRWL